MGLAGAKNKKKWAKDPNNNAWSRNTDTFAQKIMRSQGWAPGDYLGAKDASQSEYFGAANASHIKAVLKDDTMGLGAKRNGGDECVGLFDFQVLLGRLNGQSEESLDEQRRKREDARVNTYLHRKFGTMRFVFAGYLVGDKVQELADEVKRDKDAAADASSATDSKKEKKSKKRKAETDDGTASENKKSKKANKEDADDEAKAKRREKKRRDKEASRTGSNESDAEPDDKKVDNAGGTTSLRKKSRTEKKEKRDQTEKKEKKEKRTKSKIEEITPADTRDSLPKTKKRKAEKEDEVESSIPPTPIASGNATPLPNRNLSRQRFIAQKRAAVMDLAALNQIFMIKT
ncbi:unnamed protein product [Discula destructiva]